MTTETPPVFLFLAAALSLGTVLALRAWFPLRPWLAFTLAIVCGPAGHLYLPGAARYVLLMYAAWLGLLFATPLPPLVSALLLTVLSVLLMNVRVRNLAGTAERPVAP